MLADPTGLNVTMLSANGNMDFGIVANAAVADAAEIARACEAAFQELRRRVKPARPADQDLSFRKAPARRPSRTRRMPPSQRS